MQPADLAYAAPDTEVPYTDPETMVEDIAERMDYDSEVRFDPLPEYVGGVTVPEIEYSGGEIDIADSFIQLNENYLEGPAGYDQLRELQATTYHELTHGKQFEEIAASEATYTDSEMEALLFAHEGQAVFNADGRAYPDGEAFYDELYHMLEAGADAEDALEQLSEDYFMAVVQLDDGEGDGAYQLVMEDRDEIDGLEDIDDELYDDIVDDYDMEIDLAESYEVDFRDDDIDSEKVGEHLVEVQDELEERYQEIAEEDYRLLPPAATDNLGFGQEPVDQQYGPIDAPAMAAE